jgi:DNA-binding transcriptional ArsR family regulator
MTTIHGMMKSKTQTQPLSTLNDDELDQVFHALADGTRRALLRQLAQGPRSITALAAPFAMTLPAVSKHIRVLEAGGLLQREVNGRLHRCTLNVERLQDAQQWLDEYRAFWEGSLDSLARYIEQQDAQAAPTAAKKKTK